MMPAEMSLSVYKNPPCTLPREFNAVSEISIEIIECPSESSTSLACSKPDKGRIRLLAASITTFSISEITSISIRLYALKTIIGWRGEFVK